MILCLLLGMTATSLSASEKPEDWLLEDLETSWNMMVPRHFIANRDRGLMRELFETRYEVAGVFSGVSPEHFRDYPDVKVFQEQLRLVNERMGDMEPAQRRFIAEKFHEKIIDSIFKRLEKRQRFFPKVELGTQFDSNVTRTPMDDHNVSNKAGTSLLATVELGYKGRNLPWGRPMASLSVDNTYYLDDQFRARDTRNYRLRIKDRLQMVQEMIHNFSAGLDYDRTYMNIGGSLEHATDAFTPRIDFMVRPWKKLSNISDYFAVIVSLSYQIKQYMKDYELDYRGLKKDTDTTGVTIVMLNMKRYRFFGVRSSGIFQYMSRTSDSPDQEYDTYRGIFKLTLSRGEWFLAPSIMYSLRDQKQYLNDPREDKGTTVGGEFGYTLGPRLNVSANFEREILDSSFDTLSYNSTRWALNVNWKL